MEWALKSADRWIMIPARRPMRTSWLPLLCLTCAGLSLTAIRAADPLPIAEELGSTAMPYIWGSGDPARGGLDCSGFVQVVYRRAYGLELPDEAGKQYLWLREHGKVWDVTTGWKPADLRPGDLIFYSGTRYTKRPSPITHVMIYVGNRAMVGSQNAGRRLNAPGNGVGFFRFYPTPPTGNPLVDQEQFRVKLHLYAYGRIIPPEAPTGTSASAAPSQSALLPAPTPVSAGSTRP